MIVVNMKLVSAVTGKTTDLGTMILANDGTAEMHSKGNYDCWTIPKNAPLNAKASRKCRVEGHQRHAKSAWCLVAKALKAMRYAENA